MAVLLLRRVASFVALEPLIWFCLFRRVFRLRKPDDDAFNYSQGPSVGVFVIALLFSAPVEILRVELFIPWHWLQVLFLILDAHSIIRLLGYAAGIAVLLHRMTASGIQVYYGVGAHSFLPYSAIADVRRQRLTNTGRDGCHVDAQQQTASLSVGGVTNVTLRLNQPITLRRIFDFTPPIATLHLAVDEPERFVTTLKHQLAQCHDTMSAPAGAVSLEIGSAR
ncbi:MAG: hypothetical protein ACXWP0_06395 [Ktedonobacterales bacterium]